MFEPVLYIEDTAVILPRKYLRAAIYPEVIESVPLVCTDCVFVNAERKTLYLAKRKTKPMTDWWYIGGRLFAGEHARVAMCARLERETGLKIDPKRLIYLDIYRYMFQNRQQEPQDTGCDSFCYTYALELTDEEIALASAHLDTDEYDTQAGLKAFGKVELETIPVFPAIIDLYEKIFDIPVRRHKRLDKSQTVSDGRIDITQQFLKRCRWTPEQPKREDQKIGMRLNRLKKSCCHALWRGMMFQRNQRRNLTLGKMRFQMRELDHG